MCSKSMNDNYFCSNQTNAIVANNNVLRRNMETPLLNWNLEIQRSGMIKKKFHSNHIDSMKAYRTQVVLEYKRLESSGNAEQCLESFRIEGAIEVRYFEIMTI